jgi:hypothetical protein
MTEQETKDQEYFEKYGIKYHRNIKHSTCPFCGGNDVHQNDSSSSDFDEECRIPMYCEDCDKSYQAVYSFSYAVTNE